MKVVKKILYGFIIFFVLLCGFILLCAVKPELSGQIANVLNLEEEEGSQSAFAEEPEESDQDTDAVSTDGQMLNLDLTDSSEETEPEKPKYETRPTPVVWTDGPQDNNTRNNNTQNEDTQGQDTQNVDPAINGIKAPDAVAGKNGYEPIQGDNSEIDDEEAERLSEELSKGRTGDGLTFDLRFYPYYYMLNEKEKHLYRQIYANATELVDRFAPVENVSVNELKDTFAAVYNDHPELFWMDTAYACKYKKNGQCAEIDLQFNYTAENLSKEKVTFAEKAKAITDGTKELKSNYEKEKYVHDALVSKVDYVSYAKINQSAYSALVNGRTVCAGYARAFQYIMQQLGIPCYYCTGYAGESHAWNIVSLEDGYYNVDVTWDDTGKGTYDYFNKSDADFQGNHLRQDLSTNLPLCKGTAYRNLESDSNKDKDKEEDKKQEEDKDEEELDEETKEKLEKEKRTLADTGYKKEDCLTTLGDYYNDCYQKLVSGGSGNYSFQNVISGAELFGYVYDAYQSQGYKHGYMDSAMAAVGASNCRINWRIESLQDNYYMITHDVSMQ